LGLRPTEPCSSHAAVRRLRRQKPSCRQRPLGGTKHESRKPSLFPRKQAPAHATRRGTERAPDFRGLLYARVRHLRQRFRPPKARSSPGLTVPSRDPSKRWIWPEGYISPHAVSPQLPESNCKALPQGVAPPEVVARKRTTGPHGLFLPHDHTRRFDLDAARESPPRRSGYVTIP
jgi:hypothetical protein